MLGYSSHQYYHPPEQLWCSDQSLPMDMYPVSRWRDLFDLMILNGGDRRAASKQLCPHETTWICMKLEERASREYRHFSRTHEAVRKFTVARVWEVLPKEIAVTIGSYTDVQDTLKYCTNATPYSVLCFYALVVLQVECTHHNTFAFLPHATTHAHLQFEWRSSGLHRSSRLKIFSPHC
jgi:hypothetical protein